LATSVRTAAATETVAVQVEAPIDIDTDRCKGCELCIGICPKHVLELDLSVVNVLGHHPVRLLDGEACTSCALCARICPDAVFTIYRPRVA
jgi:2-oxoglutarate ferredoxin oxidoreductase subunit delta